MTTEDLDAPSWWVLALALGIAVVLGAVGPIGLLASDEVTPESLHGWDLVRFCGAMAICLFALFYMLTGYLVAVIRAVYANKGREDEIKKFVNVFHLPGRKLGPMVAALMVTLLVPYIFAIGYRMISLLQGPEAFSIGGNPGMLDFFSAFYFSVVTMATVGYGDIAPVSRWARSGTMLEIFASLVNVTIVLSALATALKDAPAKADDADGEAR